MNCPQAWRFYHLIKPSLHAVERSHNRRTKSPPTCFGTTWVPSEGVCPVVKVVVDFQTMHGTHNI